MQGDYSVMFWHVKYATICRIDCSRYSPHAINPVSQSQALGIGLTMARAVSPIELSVTSQTYTPCSLVREANKFLIKGPVKPRNESTTLNMVYQSNVRLRRCKK